MNPFAAHAANMVAYQEMCSEPVNGAAGNTIQYPVSNAGAVAGATKTFAATVGHFVVRQVYVGNGFSPRLVGQAIIQKNILPAGTDFHTGQFLIATQIGGATYVCQIQDIEDTYAEFRLNLWAQNQGA